MTFSKDDTNKLKGIAIMLLLFHHAFNAQVFETFEMHSLLPANLLVIIATQARCCVWMFVFLSAYGMEKKLQTIENGDYRNFVKKRWIALMKPFWFVFVIRFCVTYMIGRNPMLGYNNNYIYVILDFLGIADLFGTPMMSGVHWYMCMAQILILIMPILSCLCRKFGWLNVPLIFLLLQYVAGGISSQWGGTYIDYLPAAVFAVLIAQRKYFEEIYLKYKQGKTGKKICCFVGILTAIALLLWAKYMLGEISGEFNSRKIVTIVLGAIPVVCSIFVMFFCKNILGMILQFIGNYSGIMFLVHTFFTGFCGKIIYAPKWVIPSYLLLLLLSLCTSIAIDFFIKWCGNACKAVRKGKS